MPHRMNSTSVYCSDLPVAFLSMSSTSPSVAMLNVLLSRIVCSLTPRISEASSGTVGPRPASVRPRTLGVLLCSQRRDLENLCGLDELVSGAQDVVKLVNGRAASGAARTETASAARHTFSCISLHQIHYLPDQKHRRLGKRQRTLCEGGCHGGAVTRSPRGRSFDRN